MTAHFHAEPGHPTNDSGAGEEPFVDSGIVDGPPEALVLDIGGEIGALILYADESCLGQEIDLTFAGAPRSHHVHTMIRRRRAVSRHFVAGVYPELAAGDYTVWGLDGSPVAAVTIVGGEVAEVQVGSCRSATSDEPQLNPANL